MLGLSVGTTRYVVFLLLTLFGCSPHSGNAIQCRAYMDILNPVYFLSFFNNSAKVELSKKLVQCPS